MMFAITIAETRVENLGVELWKDCETTCETYNFKMFNLGKLLDYGM